MGDNSSVTRQKLLYKLIDHTKQFSSLCKMHLSNSEYICLNNHLCLTSLNIADKYKIKTLALMNSGISTV